MEIVAYLFASYLAAKHLANKDQNDDWTQYFAIGLWWPFFGFVWAYNKLVGR